MEIGVDMWSECLKIGGPLLQQSGKQGREWEPKEDRESDGSSNLVKWRGYCRQERQERNEVEGSNFKININI